MKKLDLSFTSWFTIMFITALFLFSSCNPVNKVLPTETNEPVTITASPSPVPTATELPAALKVNGEIVLLSEYENELSRFKSANAGSTAPLSDDELKKIVSDELIGQTLLAQAAFQGGFVLTPEQLQAAMQELSDTAGGTAGFQGWTERNNYSDDTLKLAISRQLAATWQRDRLIDEFPETAPQVHLRQMLLYDLKTAQDAYSRLQSGTEFDTLAKFYDPQTGGELGWVPKGYLTQPEVEEKAFELSPGQYSEIIESKIGFHIIKAIERQEDRPLTGEARQILLHQFIENWVAEQKAQAVVESNIP